MSDHGPVAAPIYARETERAVVRHVLAHPETIRSLDLPESAFYGSLPAKVWRAIREIDGLGKVPDGLTVLDYMAQGRVDENRRAIAIDLNALLDESWRGFNVERAVAQLREAGYRREIGRIDASLGDEGDPDEREEARAQRVRAAREAWGLRAIVQAPRDNVEALREFYRHTDDRGVPTGWPCLDAVLGDLHPGSVLTFLARPGIGKSTIGLNLVANWLGSYAEWGCLYHSLEMGNTLATARLVRIVQGWDRATLRHEMLAGHDPTGFLSLASQRYRLYPGAGATIHDLEAAHDKAERAMGLPIRAVVVDYFQYIRGEARESPYARAARLSAELKEYAKRRDCLLVNLCQVSRGDAGGEGWKPPTSEAARDSGTIEENADYLIAIYRPDLNPKGCEPEDRGCLHLLVRKGREGGAGEAIRLRFDEATMRLEDAGNTRT